MNFVSTLITSFFFFLPAGFSNMTPLVAPRIPGLKDFDTPVDFGKKINGIRIFGDHKTIRGFLSGTLMAMVVAAFEYNYLVNAASTALTDNLLYNYTTVNPWLLGFLLGFGALAGDALKSFFKRRVGIAPGKKWIPFDQTDYIFGAMLLSSFYIKLPWTVYLLTLILFFFLHILVTYIGYLLKFKDTSI